MSVLPIGDWAEKELRPPSGSSLGFSQRQNVPPSHLKLLHFLSFQFDTTAVCVSRGALFIYLFIFLDSLQLLIYQLLWGNQGVDHTATQEEEETGERKWVDTRATGQAGGGYVTHHSLGCLKHSDNEHCVCVSVCVCVCVCVCVRVCSNISLICS